MQHYSAHAAHLPSPATVGRRFSSWTALRLVNKPQPKWFNDDEWWCFTLKYVTFYKNIFLWLEFPLHFHSPLVFSTWGLMMWWDTYGPFLSRLSDFFEKKLESLTFAIAQGIIFSLHCRTWFHSQTTLLGFLILADRLGLSLFLYALQVLPSAFQLIQLEYVLVYQLENCHAPSAMRLLPSAFCLLCVRPGRALRKDGRLLLTLWNMRSCSPISLLAGFKQNASVVILWFSASIAGRQNSPLTQLTTLAIRRARTRED